MISTTMRTGLIAILLLGFHFDLGAQQDQRPWSMLTSYSLVSDYHPDLLAIAVSKGAPEGNASRFLVVTPRGEHVVLTNVVNPQGGTIMTRLVVESRNWWAESILHFAPADTTSEFFVSNFGGKDEPQPIHLRTSDGAEWTDAQLLPEDCEGVEFPVSKLRSEAEGPVSEVELPDPVGPVVEFLYGLLPPKSRRLSVDESVPVVLWREIVTALYFTSRRASGEVRQSTTLVLQARGRFLSIVDPDVLEFVSGFSTVNNSDPLSDFEQLINPPQQRASAQ